MFTQIFTRAGRCRVEGLAPVIFFYLAQRVLSWGFGFCSFFITWPGGSTEGTELKFRFQGFFKIFWLCQGLMYMRHGMPEIEMNR